MRHLTRLFLLCILLPFQAALADQSQLKPNADLAPDQVIAIVIDALKNNDQSNNSGIATVFDFASPKNRSSTGPLTRFTQMITAGFPDMLNHFDSSFGDIEIQNGTALQAVWITNKNGTEQGYVFQLGLQSGGEYDGMWMTDSVWPIKDKNPRGESI